MAEQKIELRKIRDFGENINDTFLFIRQNFVPLIKSLLAICAVFMLAQAIFNVVFQTRAMTIYKWIFSGTRIGANPITKLLVIQYLLVIMSILLTLLSMSVTLGAYIKYYLQNDGAPPLLEDIWTLFKNYFFKVLAYSIPVYILIAFGSCFCLVPGIYLWVVFVPFPLVVMIEDKSFSDSFARCFELVRENFWSSFAIYLTSYVIYNVCGLIIGGVMSAIVGFASYLTLGDLGNVYAVVTSFLNVFSFCFYIIFFLSAALNYFNLVEAKDGTGILSRIDNIGKNKNNFDNIEEQY